MPQPRGFPVKFSTRDHGSPVGSIPVPAESPWGPRSPCGAPVSPTPVQASNLNDTKSQSIHSLTHWQTPQNSNDAAMI